jgi:LysR family transcriptional regulator, transcription activator of glutamate synthase operon
VELRQLRYLVAVAELGSFTAAAGRLHVAQSAISRQVQTLEAELGVALLHRSRRGARPTDAGAGLLVRARRALAELEAAHAEIDGLRGLTRGRLRLGGMIPVGPFDLPGVVADFGRRHPGIEILLSEGPAGEMLAALAADRLDLTFCFRPPAEPDGLETMAIGTDRLVAATAPGEALGSGGLVEVAELAGRRLIAFPRGATARQRIDQAAAAAGVELRAAVETADLALIRELVSAGFGVAVLPAAYLREAGPEVSRLELDPPVELEPVLAWRSERSLPPAAEAFRQHVGELLEALA